MLTLEKAEETLRKLDSSSFSSSAASSAGKVVDEILVLSGEVHPKAKRRGSWFQRIHDICDLSLRLGYLPHTNVGPLSESEMRALSQVNASMGLMVEQTTPTLMGGVHRFAPNKAPALRLQQLRQAGELKIAFTTGVLLGVGETKLERLQSIRDIAAIARKYGNIQEVILQPYSPGSKDKFAKEQEQHQQQRQLSSSSDMATTMTSESSTDTDASAGFAVADLPDFIEEARHILPSEVAIQVPPNLLLHRHSSSTGHDGKNNNLLLQCINMGASDLGGISPFDEVNPDWAFPPIPALQGQLLSAGYELRQRLPIHERLIDSSCLSNRVRELVQSKRRC
jgi:FO synthase subunit 1